MSSDAPASPPTSAEKKADSSSSPSPSASARRGKSWAGAETGMPRHLRARHKMYQENIDKRGNVPKTLKEKKDPYPVGPIVLAVLLFVVVGSAIFQIIQAAQTAAV